MTLASSSDESSFGEGDDDSSSDGGEYEYAPMGENGGRPSRLGVDGEGGLPRSIPGV